LKNQQKSEFARTQFDQAVETFRTQISLIIQIATVLVVANATVVGYAMSQRTSGILFVGILFPIIILFLADTIFRSTVPIIYTAVSLELEYGNGGSDWLASTFLAFIAPAKYVEKLKAICSIENDDERAKQLRSLASPLFGKRSRMKLTLIMIAFLELIAPLILYLVFGWPLF
jgi:hypothetical protein